MPIISIDVNAPGMSGVKPKAIFIDTNDTADEVVVAGYLDHIVAQGIPISNSEIALVTTRPSPNSSDITTAWYGITFSNGQWSLVAQGGGGGGGVILPTTPNHFAIYADNAGLLYQDAATAINDGSIQANGNLNAGNPDGGQSGEVHVFPSTAASGSLVLQCVDVTDGNHVSTIKNNADLTDNVTYTLPKPSSEFDQPPTICVYDSSSPATPGNLALWNQQAGTLYDGGAVPPTIIRQSSTASLTSTTVMSLDGSGLQMVASPAPGFIGLTVSYVIINFTYGTTPYANTTGNFYISYDLLGTKRCSLNLPQSVFTATSNRVFIIYPDPTLNDFARADTTDGLYFVSDNNPTDGDSGINVTVYYSWVNIF